MGFAITKELNSLCDQKLPDGTQVFSRVGLLTTDENKPRRPKKVPKDKLEDWIRQKGDYKPGALPSR